MGGLSTIPNDNIAPGIYMDGQRRGILRFALMGITAFSLENLEEWMLWKR